MKVRTVAERTFRLSGEYDMLNASELEASLLRFAHHGHGPITVDAERLRFIDSSGIGALLRVREAMESDGRAFRVVHLPALTRPRTGSARPDRNLGVEEK